MDYNIRNLEENIKKKSDHKKIESLKKDFWSGYK